MREKVRECVREEERERERVSQSMVTKKIERDQNAGAQPCSNR